MDEEPLSNTYIKDIRKKCCKVIESCKTEDQLIVAGRYCKLALTSIKNKLTDNCDEYTVRRQLQSLNSVLNRVMENRIKSVCTTTTMILQKSKAQKRSMVSGYKG